MPQIEIPFTPGQRVRSSDGTEFEITMVNFFNGTWKFIGVRSRGWWTASELTLVEPVIEWERNDINKQWNGKTNLADNPNTWCARDDGSLFYQFTLVGVFPNPRAVAEATQKLWNEAREG